MMTFYQMVGQRILEVLEGKGWSRQKLADRLNISKQVMGKILNGEKNTTILEIREIADVLDVPVEKLLAPLAEQKYEIEPEAEEHDPVPRFMGQITTAKGKMGLKKALQIIDLINEYETRYEKVQAWKNRKVDFSGIRKVRSFTPKNQ